MLAVRDALAVLVLRLVQMAVPVAVLVDMKVVSLVPVVLATLHQHHPAKGITEVTALGLQVTMVLVVAAVRGLLEAMDLAQQVALEEAAPAILFQDHL